MCGHSRSPFLPVICALLLCTSCLPGLAEEVVRVGVAIPNLGPNRGAKIGGKGAPGVELRDGLVKALNQAKADKKSGITLQAVALEAEAGRKAVAEANDKNCQFVLYVQLRALDSSEKFDPGLSGSMGESHEVRTATLEYQMSRVVDGMSYAIGTAKGEESTSDRGAILQAVAKLGGEVLAEFRRGSSSEDHAAATSAPEQPLPAANAGVTSFCAWLPTDIPHADAIRGVCEYANALPHTMPDFICQQQTSRYQGQNHVATDLITATVRYEDGRESYSGLKRNGNPMSEAMWKTAGLWSSGQFGGSLRAIFHASNRARFEFSGENNLGGRAAWVFTFQIKRQSEPLWELLGGNEVLAPPYSGELWVDQKTGAVLHFRSVARDIPASFPLTNAELKIDFDNVVFGDGTSFVLPSEATIASKYEGFEATRNVAQFQGCHKFRATAHMVTNVPPSAADADARETAFTEVERELGQNEEIYAILREQAIREDDAEYEMERRSDLNAATVGALWRLVALEKELGKNGLRSVAQVNADLPAGTNDAMTLFKAKVDLVLVSVVLRNSKGQAVGGLTKNDFQLLDDHKPQPISSFSVETVREGKVQATGAGRLGDATSTSGENESSASENAIALLFDDLHATLQDLTEASAAATRHLSELRPEDRVAIFTTSGQVTVDFTTDQKKLQTALHGLKPHSRGEEESCPPMSYYEADLIVNQGDAGAMGMATEDALRCLFEGGGKPDAPQVNIAARTARAKAFEIVTDGRVESQTALQVLKNLIARTAATPGRRSIVLVSAGIVALTPEAQRQAASLIGQAVQAGIVINTLDASGLPTNVSATASASGSFADRIQFASGEAQARSGLMADLAYGTGGTFFHNNNDMNEGFRRTAETPEFIYVLGFSPQKLDRKFHKLKIAVNSREKLTVQARLGYYAVP